MKERVLIVCTGNSARSQMAEGFFRAKAGDSMDVYSAGTNPKGVNPLAIQVMREIAIDISRHQSKNISKFEGQHFDLVITVCDNAKETCPVWPGAKTIHWSLEDPQEINSFRNVRDDLNNRIENFLKNKN